MNTTISISKETREKLREFGKKSENYDDIINRLYNNTQMMDAIDKLLLKKGFMSLDEAKEWTELKNKADES
jgi:predicted CopG family antitoxin